MPTQDREHVHAEEQRRTLQQQAQQRAELAQYEDGLARKRSEAEHEKQRQRNAEMVMLQVCVLTGAYCSPLFRVDFFVPICNCMFSFYFPSSSLLLLVNQPQRILHHPSSSHIQEESNKRQLNERRVAEESIQAERRATEKYKAELDKEVQRERALAEAEGRTLERRKNEDIYRRYVVVVCWYVFIVSLLFHTHIVYCTSHLAHPTSPHLHISTSPHLPPPHTQRVAIEIRRK